MKKVTDLKTLEEQADWDQQELDTIIKVFQKCHKLTAKQSRRLQKMVYHLIVLEETHLEIGFYNKKVQVASVALELSIDLEEEDQIAV